MKTTRFLPFIAFLVLAGNLRAQTQTINISTGLNGSSIIPVGSNDPDWTVSGPATSGYVATQVLPTPPSVAGSTCTGGSGFVGLPGNQPGGQYKYRVSFTPYNLVGCNATNIVNAIIKFTWSNADDAIQKIYINGSSSPFFSYLTSSPIGGGVCPGITTGFPPMYAYSVTIPTSSIINGINTLEFEVFNYGGTGPTPNWLDLCADVQLTYAGIITPVFTTPATICEGSPIIATPSPFNDPSISSYQWFITECNAAGIPLPLATTWPAASVPWSAGFPSSTYTFPPFSSGGPYVQCGKYYQVKLAAKNFCSNWGEYNQVVRIQCGPTVTIGGDLTICTGDCVTMTDNSGPKKQTTYNWYDQSSPLVSLGSTKTLIVCPTQTTTYCLTETSLLTGCSTTACKTITVYNTDPSFTLVSNTANSAYMELFATPNQTTGLPPTFYYKWYVDELITVWNPPVWSVVNPACWQVFPGTITNVFPGISGLTQVFDPTCAVPPIGQFKYNTLYRITRVTGTEFCQPRQYSVLVLVTPSEDPASGLPAGITIEEDLNAPDMTNRHHKNYVIQNSETGARSFAVYPNPASSLLNVEYDLMNTSAGNIAIADLSGRVMQTVKLAGNANKIQLDVSALQNGAYFVNLVEADKLIATRKIIIAK